MLADGARTILVIGARGNLWAALHESIDARMALVRWAAPGEAAEAIRSCRPWPWAVVMDGSGGTEAVLDLCRARPVLLLWMGRPPAPLPGHAQVHSTWTDVAAALHDALGKEVAGLRLAAATGLSAGSSHIRCPELEALVAAHPKPVEFGSGRTSAAARALRSHGIALKVARSAGGWCLIPAVPT
jgi:hypothetical protein